MSELQVRQPQTRKVEVEREYRHWSPVSQAYATADILLQHLRDGWTLGRTAALEAFHLGNGRHVDVYYFTLLHGNMVLEMPVVSSPVVLRLIMEQGLTVMRVSSQPQTHA